MTQVARLNFDVVVPGLQNCSKCHASLSVDSVALQFHLCELDSFGDADFGVAFECTLLMGSTETVIPIDMGTCLALQIMQPLAAKPSSLSPETPKPEPILRPWHGKVG